MLGERLGQIERLRFARFFDPLFVKNASIDAAGVDEIVAAFKLFEHRDFRNDPAGMKNKLAKYLAAVEMIPPLSRHLDKEATTASRRSGGGARSSSSSSTDVTRSAASSRTRRPRRRPGACSRSSATRSTTTDDQLASPADHVELNLQL